MNISRYDIGNILPKITFNKSTTHKELIYVLLSVPDEGYSGNAPCITSICKSNYPGIPSRFMI